MTLCTASAMWWVGVPVGTKSFCAYSDIRFLVVTRRKAEATVSGSLGLGDRFGATETLESPLIPAELGARRSTDPVNLYRGVVRAILGWSDLLNVLSKEKKADRQHSAYAILCKRMGEWMR